MRAIFLLISLLFVSLLGLFGLSGMEVISAASCQVRIDSGVIFVACQKRSPIFGNSLGSVLRVLAVLSEIRPAKIASMPTA